MITLTLGHDQNASNLAVPGGSISLQLNTDGSVLAAPYGLVMGNIPVSFYFDRNGDLEPGAQIWSNAELLPQNERGFATYYLVSFYDANGSPLNTTPMWWQFQNPAGSTVDISTMTAYVNGGNVIYYPRIPTALALTSDDASIEVIPNSTGPTDIRIGNVANVKHFGGPLTGAGKQNYACGMAAVPIDGTNIVTLRLGTHSNPNAPITGGQLFDAATDVGKSVLVSGPVGGAHAVQVQDLWTTIVSVQSPTQATLADYATPDGIATNFSGTIYWWDPAEDDTAAIQAAINACDDNNQYSKVYLPGGVYIRTGTFTNSMNMKEFYGDGMQRTVILTKTRLIDTDAVNFYDQVDFKMHDLTWRGPGVDAPFGGSLQFKLFVESTLQNLSFENVEIRHVAYDGMYMDTAILTTFKNCLFNYNAGHGLNLNIAVACTFDSCYFITNLLAGCNMTGCAGLAFNACGSESNGIGYYMNGGTWSVSFNGVDAEYQTQRAAKRPASFPAISVTAGGSVALGTYHFNYTWLRRVTNNATPVESLPSPESLAATTTGGNQTISFTLPIAPTDVPYIYYANVYATNAASGSEVFVGTFPLNPSATTTITLSTPINLGSGIPLPVTAMTGHMYAVENSNNISITGSSCNTVPCTESRFLVVTGSSYDVSTRDLRLIQQTSPNPDHWMEVGAPGYGQTASSRINLECGDITDSQVLIDASITNVRKWFSDIFVLPNPTVTGKIFLSNTGVVKWGTDAGISRDSAGVLACGNGDQDDFTGVFCATQLQAVHLSAKIGSTVLYTDFTPSGGFGTSPVITVAGTSKDQGGQVTVQAKATTGANPTLTFVFHNGTWGHVPAVTACSGDTSGLPWVVTSISATQVVFTLLGTPVANSTYVLNWTAMGT